MFVIVPLSIAALLVMLLALSVLTAGAAWN